MLESLVLRLERTSRASEAPRGVTRSSASFHRAPLDQAGHFAGARRGMNR
jgi:hypothetical protein